MTGKEALEIVERMPTIQEYLERFKKCKDIYEVHDLEDLFVKVYYGILEWERD